MPLSPIPEENENNSPRMPFQNGMKKTENTNTYHLVKQLEAIHGHRKPFQNGMKKTKNTNTYKYLQTRHPENIALVSKLRPTASAVVPSNATRKAVRKAAKKVRHAAAKASAKKRTRRNRR